MSGWISRLDENDSVKAVLHNALDGQPLTEKQKRNIAFNLFEGKKMALLLNAAPDTLSGLKRVDSEIKQQYSFDNKALIEQIQKYVFIAINSISQCSEISKRYNYFDLNRRMI